MLQLGSGLDTINISSKHDLLDAIDELIGIVADGELDDEIEVVATKGISAYTIYQSLRPKKLRLNAFLEKFKNRK
jgi:hypothetical protein